MNPPILVLDCETASAVPIKDSNVYNYARHWTTRFLGFCYAFNNETVKTWTGRTDGENPKAVVDHIRSGGTVVAHNAAFERAMFQAHLGIEILPSQCVDTMHLAAAAGLPRKLEEVAKVLNIEEQKDMAGHRIMLAFARPWKTIMCCGDPRCEACRGTWTRYIWRTAESHPAQWKRLWDYCARDVQVTRALYAILPKLSPSEHAMQAIDASINARGVLVDRPAAAACQGIIDLETKRINQASRELTGCDLVQTGKVTQWCQARDARVKSLAKDPVKKLLALDDLDPEVRAYLELREGGAKSSVKKVATLLNLTSDDARLRWSYAFLGAISTGRWAGRGFQPQNLPRGTELKLKARDVDEILSTLATHGASTPMLEWLRAAYGPPLTVISECLRGLLIASPGKTLVGADMNAIEARVLAWLAQESWVLSAFERGDDLYVEQYARAFGIDPRVVDEYQRLVGKVMMLAFGYQGAMGAWNSMAVNYSIPPLSEPEIKRLVEGYRITNPAIVSYWWACEQAAKEATAQPGRIVVVGPLENVRYCHHDGHLWCELPSKRRICYPFARLEETFDRGRSRVSLEYMGPHKVTRQWTTRHAYGGLLVENIVQAASSDLLRSALARLVYPHVVMHTHDEVTVECTPGMLTVKELENILSVAPSWATGLPLKAKGWTCRRYQK